MKTLRWKRHYQTGDAATDSRNQSLAALLLEVATRMREKEHCQDMSEWYDDLVWLAERRFGGTVDGDPTAAESDAEIRGLITERLPLPAKGTAACRDCGICEWTERQVTDWLGGAAETTEREPSRAFKAKIVSSQ